ncbi:MAG: GAF domain-containing sensor histidine kinase [Pedobacter sp.]|uniref:GAF domain-containing sensor histidine kinase n=1 Tax=Pedobacter sp. TaxID=1411316 RepID=UPI0028073EC9|nr:GAF domain-containing sensor histidine kinase [Pedobacter sp.]MDQ8003201.1 GAF domain-containing sensor histidine kinase [Pedobacter sp.]
MQSTRPIPPNEAERLATLFELDLDYVSLNNSFEDLSYLAAKITGTEISLISFIDSYTQWIVSRFGLEVYQTPIDDTVCQYTIMEDDHLEIEDLSKDKRFDGKGIADEPMNLRYYLGIPLKTNSGYNIGSLCVLDTNFHKLSQEKIDQLKIVAKQVITRINDTNAIKSLEKKLATQNDTYKKVAHDIRGPIAGIIGLADMISNDKDEYPSEELHNIVGMMGKSGQSVLDLADEILKNSLKDAVYAPEVFTLRIFKEKLEKLYQPQAFNKQIKLEIQTNIAFDTIQIKKDKLLQISGNIISNAIKFTPNDGKITAILDLIIETDKKTLILEVQDTGTGIAENTIKEILEGSASSNDGTIGEKGYGFGLPCVKKLLREIGGEISINSVIGQGSQFKIRVPNV